MAQMDLSPVPDPRLQKPVLPIAQGAPEPQPAPAPSAPAPMAQTAQPAEKLNTVPLAFPQLGMPNESQNQQTLRQTQQKGSGISNIHNPILKTAATIGDILLGTFAPRAEQLTPGTEGNHALHLARAGNAVKSDEDIAMAPVERRLKSAQAANQESLPEFHEAQNDVKRLTAENTAQHNADTAEIARTKNQGTLDIAAAKDAATLAQHGFKKDEAGQIVPLEYGEMSPTQQAVTDLKAAQTEQAQATAALKKAQAENQPAMAALAKARLDSANNAHAIASRRLDLSEAQFEMRAHGTQSGEALPGSMITEGGQPVGTAFQQNVRPTGQQRNKSDMGVSAHEQIQDIREIVTRRPDIFGPAAGRKTDFTVWIGSQDPDAQAFRAARTIAGDHLAGTFGGRSEAALQALDEAIGHFKDNPAAIVRGLDQIDKANKVFIDRGTVRTTGSNAAKPAESPDMVTVKMQDGRTGQIHSSQKDRFLKDNPGSAVVNNAAK